MFAAYIAASVSWALMIYVIFMNKQRTPAAYFSQIRRLAADIGIRMSASHDSPGVYGPGFVPMGAKSMFAL